jgi:hypothetical protein
MIRRKAATGRWAGQDFWGCSEWGVTGCRGRVHIGPPQDGPSSTSSAGASAQARFEQERRRYKLRVRAAVPFLTAVGLLLMAMMFFAFSALSVVTGAIAATLTGLGWIVVLTRLPPDALFWDKGARGERKTADYLEPLLERGFVFLHDRQIPGSRANIDHIAIGPTGVFVIETKHLSGKVEVIQDRLLVSDRLRSNYIEETYREAYATQVALRELVLLTAAIGTVPVEHREREPAGK